MKITKADQLKPLAKRYPSFAGTPHVLALSILRRDGVVIVKASLQKISVEAVEPQ